DINLIFTPHVATRGRVARVGTGGSVEACWPRQRHEEGKARHEDDSSPALEELVFGDGRGRISPLPAESSARAPAPRHRASMHRDARREPMLPPVLCGLILLAKLRMPSSFSLELLMLALNLDRCTNWARALWRVEARDLVLSRLAERQPT
ncbi:hypothetical protein T492DRAFT_937124, partial [Pavlovales sp. CCMP2436]